MKAMFYDAFGQAPIIADVPDPTPTEDGVVIEVGASGVCRSDWHGWMGHDPDIRLPHVPGHELAGRVVATGRNVRRFKAGDRVTVPFVSGCGRCAECRSGNQQVCPDQFQPGFTHWGSFARYVAIDFAETNLVTLPDSVDDATRTAAPTRSLIRRGGVSVAAAEWARRRGRSGRRRRCGGAARRCRLPSRERAQAWERSMPAVCTGS